MLARRRLAALTVAVAMVVAACGGDDDDADSNASQDTSESTQASEQEDLETVTIGVIGNMTGIGAEPWGKPIDAGMRLALDEIEESGYLADVGVELELELEDDGTEPTRAVTIFNGYEQDGIEIVVSHSFTPILAAVTPLANDTETLYLNVGSAGTGENEEDFAFFLNDSVGPNLTLGEYLVKEGIKRPVAIVDGDNAAFGFLAGNIEKGIQEAGNDGFIATETVATTDTDFSSVITNLERENPDAVILAITPAASGNALQQIAQAGAFPDALMVGSIGWSSTVHDVAGDAAVGASFSQPWAPGAEGSEAFSDAYMEANDTAPTAYSALGYQAGWLLATAIKMAKDAGDEITGPVMRDLLAEASTANTEHTLISGFTLDDAGVPSYPGVVATFGPDGAIESVS